MFRYLSSVCSLCHRVFPLNVCASSKVFRIYLFLFDPSVHLLRYTPLHTDLLVYQHHLIKMFYYKPPAQDLHLEFSVWTRNEQTHYKPWSPWSVDICPLRRTRSPHSSSNSVECCWNKLAFYVYIPSYTRQGTPSDSERCKLYSNRVALHF